MERTEVVMGILASLAIIVGVVFYIGTHVDCAKIPLVGTTCIAK